MPIAKRLAQCAHILESVYDPNSQTWLLEYTYTPNRYWVLRDMVGLGLNPGNCFTIDGNIVEASVRVLT